MNVSACGPVEWSGRGPKIRPEARVRSPSCALVTPTSSRENQGPRENQPAQLGADRVQPWGRWRAARRWWRSRSRAVRGRSRGSAIDAASRVRDPQGARSGAPTAEVTQPAKTAAVSRQPALLAARAGGGRLRFRASCRCTPSICFCCSAFWRMSSRICVFSRSSSPVEREPAIGALPRRSRPAVRTRMVHRLAA